MSFYDRNQNSFLGQNYAKPGIGAQEMGLAAYMRGVYNNMVIGLIITGLAAWLTNLMAVTETASGHLALSAFGHAIYASPLRWVIMLAPLGLVMLFSFQLNRMQADTARALFFVFAAVMGLSLSSILLVYTGESITQVFFITAFSFAGLSFYGYTTQRSLSAMGSFMMMGLWGIIIASFVNIFMQSSEIQWATSFLAIIIFAGLTAWDTQAIKQLYYAGDGYEVAAKKSIYGALMLYMDFINIFISLLQIMGTRRSD